MVDFIFDGTEVTGGAPSLWLTETEADSYLAYHPDALGVWTTGVDSDSGDPTKAMCLTQAQRQLQNDARWTIEEPDSGDEQDQAIKDAICEQALFIMRNRSLSVRVALQAVGVVDAGIVHERFDGAGPRVPICPQALNLLRSYAAEDSNTFEWSR